MQALCSRTPVAVRAHSVVHGKLDAPASAPPRCRSRPAVPSPVSWASTPSRSYYFDAAHQTALTLKELLRVAVPGGEPLGICSNTELLRNTTQSLVDSVCPRLDDDYESQSLFNQLLSMHLSGLSTRELTLLSQLLKSAGFDGVASESVCSDAMYEKFGFANGPLQMRQRTLMLPQDWQVLIDQISEQVAASEQKLPGVALPNAAESRFARHCLARATQVWATSDKSVTAIGEICDDLCGMLGLDHGPGQVLVTESTSRASSIDWRGDRLLLGQRAFDALKSDTEGRAFAAVLRDLLEAIVARRMFGRAAHPDSLAPGDLMLLYRAIDAITAEPPPAPTAAMCEAAASLMARAGSFGKVQILPMAGVSLGHAWIGDALSIVPDLTQRPTNVGKSYMRPGRHLHPDQHTVHEWPIRWLTPTENGSLYPSVQAWHITVPVPALKLQTTAREVAQQWKAENRRYRFVGTEPGMPSSGCRASVLQAIGQGMDADAQALFAHFNAGLAEPDSPTEVALRMNRFMQWLRQLSTPATVS